MHHSKWRIIALFYGMCLAVVFGHVSPVHAAITATSSTPAIDSDGDGLTDVQETLLGTDSLKKDTDDDGFSDDLEIQSGHSPTSTQTFNVAKEIRITLKNQQMHQVFGGISYTTSTISSGKPGMRTPIGTFKILNKNKRAWSSSAKLWMPWWMAFTRVGHGIHELPEWPGGKKEGANHLGTPVSHGCVRLGVGPAKTLYDWAPIGTKIVITN